LEKLIDAFLEFYPEGIAAISRWSSEANTTGNETNQQEYPKGISAQLSISD
jgi:hypothetical protein